MFNIRISIVEGSKSTVGNDLIISSSGLRSFLRECKASLLYRARLDGRYNEYIGVYNGFCFFVTIWK